MASSTDRLAQSLAFERTRWVDDTSVTSDAFYTTPSYQPDALPGTLLRLDDDIDHQKYHLPPGITITRIIYLSRTLNGTLVPVSAAILWPYSPKVQPDGKYPVVAWAHGTSGLDADAAPSHNKNLWQHHLAPYPLALAGYVVVATDYAGLGVHHYPDDHELAGSDIVLEYLASPAHANDVVYSVYAARKAFPKLLSRDFVVMGHSQGGGATWGVAQRRDGSGDDEEEKGPLGCVAVSPTTRFVDEPEPFASVFLVTTARGMKGAIPEVDLGKLLTEEGLQRYEAAHNTNGAGVESIITMLVGAELTRPGWKEDKHVLQYQEMVQTGGEALQCPLLVMHGEQDPALSIHTVRASVEKTRNKFPESHLDMVVMPGMTHAPALTAGMSTWLQWIADRFEGKPVDGPRPGKTTVAESARPLARYEGEQNWNLEHATESYHIP